MLHQHGLDFEDDREIFLLRIAGSPHCSCGSALRTAASRIEHAGWGFLSWEPDGFSRGFCIYHHQRRCLAGSLHAVSPAGTIKRCLERGPIPSWPYSNGDVATKTDRRGGSCGTAKSWGLATASNVVAPTDTDNLAKAKEFGPSLSDRALPRRPLRQLHQLFDRDFAMKAPPKRIGRANSPASPLASDPAVALIGGSYVDE
jgi:hypothetical protein